MQQEQGGKKVQQERSATFHLVHTDMMKHMIIRLSRERGSLEQKLGRKAETHEM